jgi:hypothetical protein
LQQPPISALGEIDPTGALALEVPPTARASNSSKCRPRGKEYIKAGDIFQFVPSQRLRVQASADPFDVYRALRIINPSPFMFYLKSPACTLIGSSPEILCRVEDGVVTSRPLAGTRRRGATPEEDRPWKRNCWPIPRSGPSTSCWSICTATTSAGWRKVGSVQASAT